METPSRAASTMLNSSAKLFGKAPAALTDFGGGFGVAYREMLFHDGGVELDAQIRIGHREQGPGMAGADVAACKPFLDGRRKLEQTQRIGYGRAAFAELFGKSFLTESVREAERLQGFGFFQRIKVLALEIFHESHGHGVFVGIFSDDDRYFCESCQFGGPPASFTGYDLVTLRHTRELTHEQRLDDALIADGYGQFAEGCAIEVLARLMLARNKLGERQLSRFFGAVFGGGTEK